MAELQKSDDQISNSLRQFPWENLAFEGGGAKGYAYIGAIQCLETYKVYPQQIKRVAGTSIGSLFAILVALGCSTEFMTSSKRWFWWKNEILRESCPSERYAPRTATF